MFIVSVRRLLPSPVRRRFRQFHQENTLRRAVRRLDPGPWAGLVYGWGNEPFSALAAYLEVVATYGRSASGPVLECGSGLTTLVLAAVGADVWVLEHDEFWLQRVEERLDTLGLVAQLHAAPIRSYGDFDWYEVNAATMPVFSLVVCDGPPGTVRGGRYGLLPVLGERLAKGCTILLDDAGRPGEQEVLTGWNTSITSCDIRGSEKPYAVIVLR